MKMNNNNKNNNIVVVVPQNDAEAVRIVEILTSQNVKALVTKQAWGASWENLEAHIKEELATLQDSHHIYGVELMGTPLFGGTNIDHHSYDGDNRSNELCSLEQVANLIGYKLNIEDMFISSNDKEYIDGMYSLGEALAMSQEEIANMVSKVRALDRAAQGISQEQETIAEEAIVRKEVLRDDSYLVRMSHSKTSTVCDRMYGSYKNLLIISEDGEVNFFGRREIINKLKTLVSGSWSDGKPENKNGYWGGYPSDQEAIVNIVKSMI